MTGKGVLTAIGVAALAALAAGCPSEDGGAGSGKVDVVTTVGFLGDAAKVIGGDRVEVTALMGPGVDPHLYKATEGDIRRLSEADLILYVGVNLEGKMGDLFVKMARRGLHTVAVTEDVDPSRLREPPEFQGHYDPHVWFDVSLWRDCVARVERALVAVDPEGKKEYAERAARYLGELEALHDEVKLAIATIPRDRRVLVTSHDAFGYFGRAYDIDVVGIQGISTVSEAGLSDLRRVKDTVKARAVRAVFGETSVNDKSLRAVVEGLAAEGHEVHIGGRLFSDSMGAAGTPEGTYIGMVRANVRTIVEALR